MHAMRNAAAAILLLAAFAAQGAPLEFGERRLEVPVPEGFEPVSRRLPQFITLAQAYLPAGNRLVEAYLLPDDIAAMERGEAVDIKRYFQVQTLRKLDGVPVSASEFEEVSGQLEASLGKAIDDASEQGAELARQGNAAAKRQAGVDPQVGLDGIAYLGSFRKEAWALFFTTRAVVTLGAEQVPATSAATLAVIDHQVTYLYAYTYENDASGHGRSWAERAVSDWANSVRWANPDDPELEAKAQRLSGGGLNAYGLGRAAGIGAFIGLVVWFFRRRGADR